MYLEPKPEWRARLPYLPAIILLGDRHEPKPPCPGFDLDDGKTKEVGGTQSFWHFLDTDPALTAFTKDVVLEFWLPKHARLNPHRAPIDLSCFEGGPLLETWASLSHCVGQVRTPACVLANVRVHVADLRQRYIDSELNEEHLRDCLFAAIADPKDKHVFLDKCRAIGQDPERVVRRLLSLNILTDLDDEHLRTERLAHEFNQLHASVQAELRQKLAAIPQQQYPYDLPQAVVEWMNARSEEHCHPVVEKDMRDLAEEEYMLRRRTTCLELYALSRMLKEPRDETIRSRPRVAVLYVGVSHCRHASYLMHGMYNIHGAAACSHDSGCIDFASPTDTCYPDYSLENKYVQAVVRDPQRPIAW
jgi:hypothetical protein